MGKRIDFTSPSSGASSPVSNNPGIWLPYGGAHLWSTSEGLTVHGAPNQQQQCMFVSQYTVTIGHVAYQIGTGLAGSLGGVAIYSGDGLTKLTSADAMSTAAAGVKRVALSSQITIVQGTSYWLGWTGTDTVTVTWANILETILAANIITAGALRYGRNVTNPTAGGVTLNTISNTSLVQLRIPLFFFDL